MTIRSTLLLAGAMLAGITTQANAVSVVIPTTVTSGDDTVNAGKTETVIFGGGSSLIAPYIREAADCFGDKIDLGSNGKNTTSNILNFKYLGTPTATCGTTGLQQPGTVVSYISTGSGRGFMGFFSHNALYSAGQGNMDTWLVDGTAAVPVSADPFYANNTSRNRVNFAAADAGLPQTDPNFGGDITTYNNGGYVSANKISIQVATPTGGTPGGPVPSGTIVSVLYPNPLKTYGPAVQIPLLVAAPVVAFSPVYKKVRTVQGATSDTPQTEKFYSFSTAGSPGSLKLPNTQLCQIFQGQISNWNQLPTTVVNKASTDSAPFSVPLQIVGRSDGSGTTAIVYRHLAKVCGTTIYTVPTSGTVPTKLPTALQGPVTDPNNPNTSPTGENPGQFTLANGSGGIAAYLAFTTAAGPNVGDIVEQGRIGYIGEDFVLPYVLQNGQNKFGLTSASLQNFKKAFVASTPAGALAAFGTVSAPVLLPPQSSSTGTYVAANFNPDGTGKRSDPASNNSSSAQANNKYGWTSASNVYSPLADPISTGAYPLVGTTNGLFYQCYADPAEAALVRSFLSWYYTTPIVNDRTKGILAKNGFSPVPASYLQAINDTFINNTQSLGLEVEVSGAGSPAAACTRVAGA